MKRLLIIIIWHITLVGFALMTLVPIVWMVAASLMPAGEAMAVPPRLIPTRFTLTHFAELFTRLHVWRFVVNSLVVSLGITCLALLFNGMAGYAFAKLHFPGRDPVFRWLLMLLVIPTQVAMLPLFLLLRHCGAINTYWAVILPAAASVYGIFLVRQYALSVPQSMLDAARVDGAGEGRIFFTIVVPVIQPVLVALGIFTFLAAWNDFLWPLIVMTDNDMYTLPVALAVLSGEHVQDTELMMAGSVVTVLPVVIGFLVLQKQLLGGIMTGSVKG